MLYLYLCPSKHCEEQQARMKFKSGCRFQRIIKHQLCTCAHESSGKSAQRRGLLCSGADSSPTFVSSALLYSLSNRGDVHLQPLWPPIRGSALCWRRRCPTTSRLRWGSAPPGPDTGPTHASSSSLSPVEVFNDKQQHKWLTVFNFLSPCLLVCSNVTFCSFKLTMNT